MAIVRPFKGLLYNTQVAGEVQNLVCPPYDVISPEEQEYFYSLSPYNIIRVELGKQNPEDDEKNNVYSRAKDYLETWINNNILVFDDEPHYYLYKHEFYFEGRRYERSGIVAAVKIEDYETKTILPHEKTLPKAKEDRLRLLRETHTNVSMIFSFFSDSTRKARLVINEVLKNEKPLFEFKDRENVVHSLYRIPKKYDTDVFESLYDAQLFIADGHHRYETALRYRNEMREIYGEIEDAWYEYVLTTVVPIEADMVVLPIHRIVDLKSPADEKQIVNNLSIWFDVKPVPGSEHLRQEVYGSDEPGTFGVVTPSNSFVIKARKESLNVLDKSNAEEIRLLDANIFNEIILGKVFEIGPSDLESRVKFTSNFREIVEIPKQDKTKVSFALRPVSIDTVKKIAIKGLIMPQKTTYFYPKLWTGLVMRCNLKV